MKRIALTLITILLLLGTVFAAPNTVIIKPFFQQIANNSLDINFTVFEVTDITRIQIDRISPTTKQIVTDNNVYDDSQIICIKDTNFYCKYNWNTGDLLDSNNYKIRITITSSPIAPPQVESDYFMIDNTSPTISNNFPDNNKWINPEIVKFSFVVSDATSGVDENSIIFRVLGNDYNIDSGKVDYNAVSGVVDFNSTGIDFNNGEMYTLTIDVNDFAKNKSTMDLNFWVDKNNPTITKFEVEEITNKQKPDFNIVAEDQEGLSGLNKMYFSCNNTMDIANWKSADYSDTYNDFNITDPTYGCNSSDGNKTIYLRVQDLAGNYSAIMDKNTNYDTSKPIVSMTRSDNNLWANNPVDVNITCTDASPTKIKYWLNGNLTTSDKNHVSFTINQDKNHELIYYCEDKVLNSDGNHYAYIGIDINGPYPINFSLPIAQNTTDVNLFWSETLPLSDVNFIVWKKKDTDSDFNKIFGPTPNNNHIDTNTALDQNYCYKIQSINQFGRDTNSDTYCVFIDLNSPIINNVTASPSNNNVTISVNATDNNGSGIKGYYYSMDKNNWNFSASNSYTFSGLANGTHTFYVFATDYADNNSEDKNVQETITSSSSPGSPSGSSGGGGGWRPSGRDVNGGTISITNKDVNKEVILEKEKEEPIVLPKVVDTNFTSETNQSSVDANKIIVTTIEEPTTGTGFFGLDNLIRISFWPLLLLIALFLLLLLLAKRRKDEDESWGSERIFVEDDTKDMDMKTWSGKWSHKK